MLATNYVVFVENEDGSEAYLPVMIFYASWCKDAALNGGCRAAIS